MKRRRVVLVIERSFELQNLTTIVLNIIYLPNLSNSATNFKYCVRVKRWNPSRTFPNLQLNSPSILSNLYPANKTVLCLKNEHNVLFKDHARFGDNTICNIPFTPTQSSQTRSFLIKPVWLVSEQCGAVSEVNLKISACKWFLFSQEAQSVKHFHKLTSHSILSKLTRWDFYVWNIASFSVLGNSPHSLLSSWSCLTWFNEC